MLRILFFSLSVFFLTSCTETQLVAHTVKQIAALNGSYSGKTNGHYKVGKPYKIGGKRFYPREQWDYEEVGLASWYGPKFHGKKTANGEIFNQYELVAAHRTLQLPSIVEVTNLENGRKIIVRVCDRGPYVKEHHRIIDLSMRGAELLGFKRQGTARVKVRLLKEESAYAASAIKQGYRHMGGMGRYDEKLIYDKKQAETEEEPKFEVLKPQITKEEEPYHFRPLVNNSLEIGSHYVQLGAFEDFKRAQQFGIDFKKYGDVSIESNQYIAGKTPLFRVKIGPVETQEEAEMLLSEIQKEWQDAILVTD